MGVSRRRKIRLYGEGFGEWLKTFALLNFSKTLTSFSKTCLFFLFLKKLKTPEKYVSFSAICVSSPSYVLSHSI